MIVLAVFTDARTCNGQPLGFNIADALRDAGQPVAVVPVPVMSTLAEFGSHVAGYVPLMYAAKAAGYLGARPASLVSVVWSGASGTSGNVPPAVWHRHTDESVRVLEQVTDSVVVGEPPLVRSELGNKRDRRWARRLAAFGDGHAFRANPDWFQDIGVLSADGADALSATIAASIMGVDGAESTAETVSHDQTPATPTNGAGRATARIAARSHTIRESVTLSTPKDPETRNK